MKAFNNQVRDGRFDRLSLIDQGFAESFNSFCPFFARFPDGAKDFENKTSTAGVVPHSRYLVENILLFYVPDGSQKDERIYLVIEEMRSLQ
ncbi:hypothetical protein J2T17_007525 [Paenibacillus mucilaginosus]|uniref:hypothetical protein n=1 Tax=Paenibacillus mucilaginosus TaxID=61624 RepID=UPI003D1D6130